MNEDSTKWLLIALILSLNMRKQRKIKFRYFDKITKHFIYSDDFDWNNDFEKLEYFFQKAKLYSDDKIQQFTNLTDKNGKEIYEGDIVKQYGEYNQSYNTEVIFAKGRFIPLVKVEYGYNTIDEFNNEYYEVIGNIFENPELLLDEK